jgi:hypothetical protein
MCASAPTSTDVAHFAPHKSRSFNGTCRGTGGRQAAKDPRLDPAIDAKKARQILNNRKNAAISQLRKKIAGLVREGGSNVLGEGSSLTAA